MDQIDGLTERAAGSLTPVEWAKVCECLGLTLPTDDGKEIQKAIRELDKWKGKLVDEGVDLVDIRKKLQGAMHQAGRPDLADYLPSGSCNIKNSLNLLI